MDKVFFTNITRTYNKSNEDLYELLKVDPAVPVPTNPTKTHTCDFQPRCDKQYIPKKKHKVTVNTVRDIRNLYEKDVMTVLPLELEKQQNILLRKIKGGTSKDEKTRSLAKNLLTSNKPMTRSSWQMLMNINPECHTHSVQYVLWNGKPIRVNGSKGGKNKYICNYDIGKKREVPFYRKTSSKNVFTKKSLLRNSLSINFKPGPLTRKKFLDNSYQKYHVGKIDVVDLPKPGLEIQPLYGSALDPTICNFVNSLREENGTITEKWAQFAVSVVGSLKGSKNPQLNDERNVTFDLNYRHDQTKILMRKDQENINVISIPEKNHVLADIHDNDEIIMPEVRAIMKGILDAVEISIIQDNLFTEDDEIRNDCQTGTVQNYNKEKLKRKYGELDRLDVTVITLSEDTIANDDKNCHNSFCALGCVCSSLQSTINLKGHCGLLECMFQCKCDFPKHKWIEGLDNDCPDLLPGLLNLNNKINFNLAKEEQKFHQTVIMTGDKSILLKSKKRNTKFSKKYAEFHSTLCIKPESKAKPAVLAIIEPRLNCENIEPLCMVHNLYKCFCKGKFIESSETASEKETNTTEVGNELKTDVSDKIKNDDLVPSKKEKEGNSYNTRTKRDALKKEVKKEQTVTIELDDENEDFCARVLPYDGRKYSNGYYMNANNKIRDMEINDVSLRKRLLHLTGKSEKESNARSNSLSVQDIETVNVDCQKIKENYQIADCNSNNSPGTSKPTFDTVQISCSTSTKGTTNTDTTRTDTPILRMIDSTTTNRLSNKPKLVAWLESSYQQYKRRLDSGSFKATLEAPKKGKVALYPWDFILSRYSERKNLFLVTKEPPYRIFMAVSASNPLFGNCINIDDIRFVDLKKYPASVKNLLTNTSDLKDYFCILFGLSSCWEFIGSVTKVGEPKEKQSEDEILDAVMSEEPDDIPTYDSDSHTDSLTLEDIERLSAKISEEKPEKSSEKLASESSKWFIMTIENDFTEIQFYNRGFFVKYASIIQAIDVSRTSGKTVRLSSQKLADSNGPQFGIYAVPSANDDCVFVGPYEVDESLGIETIKSTLLRKGKKTRGVWITTGKVDNIKVIDNPLSFIPTQKDMVPLDNETSGSKTSEIQESQVSDNRESRTKLQSIPDDNDKEKPKEIIKIVKPIKIRKTNGFYHLSNKSLLKPLDSISSSNQTSSSKRTTVRIRPNISDVKKFLALDKLPVIVAGCDVNNRETVNINTLPALVPISNVANINLIKQGRPVAEVAPQIKIASVYSEASPERPVAEVAPQIKIASVYSEASPEKHVEAKKREGRGMFILKPEEINQRIENKLNKAASSETHDGEDESEDTMDVEYFLDNSDVCPAPINLNTGEENLTDKAVYIECENVNLGVLRGTMNKMNLISFVFPGFKPSEFYEPEVAFIKLNQVLSRKVYMPKQLNLKWKIVDSIDKLRSSRLLQYSDIQNNVILTERGFENIDHKLEKKKYNNIKTYSRKVRIDQDSQEESRVDQISESSQKFEEHSQYLEDESHGLFTEIVTKKDDIQRSICQATDIERDDYENTLHEIRRWKDNMLGDTADID